MVAVTLSWKQVLARRLSRHGLAAPVPAGNLADQVGAICGAHAQVISAAEISIGLRVAGITRADVRNALWEERTLVKTYGPRGTVHLLDVRDLPAWNAVLDVALVPPGFPPDVRLTADQTDEVVAAIDDALGDGDLTIDELDAEVARRAGTWAGERVMPAFQELWPRWRQAVRAAATRGALCFGPSRGAKTVYTSPRRWLVADHAMTLPDAEWAVLRRYLHAYGPARPEHLARWLGATPAWAKDLFRRFGDGLERVDVDGEALWQLADEDGPPPSEDGAVRLLPYFDAYVVGSYPREWVFPGRAAERALARTQAGNVPVLLVDGTVTGIWHQRRTGSKVALTVEPFRQLAARERRALEAEAERIGRIQEAAATVTVGTVTAGPHA
jgi:hypothetical protein